MKWVKRLLARFRTEDMDQLWLEEHHVPLKDIAGDVRFYCAHRGCEHWYSVYYAIHIGFHCHRCYQLLHLVDDS